MENNTIIRVGEKNNFNFTAKELKELKKYEKKGEIFVNCNSFTKIKKNYPSFVTINPYLLFHEPKGDMSNVKAFRIKLFISNDKKYMEEQKKAILYAKHKKIPILITFMRFRSKKSLEKYNINKDCYIFDHGYYRPQKNTQKKLLSMARKINTKVFCCDQKGTGCPDCKNCTILSYGDKNANIKALNLSISGIEDKKGKRGLCRYQCPDCWAKIVNMGLSPACDQLINNNKISGKIIHI